MAKRNIAENENEVIGSEEIVVKAEAKVSTVSLRNPNSLLNLKDKQGKKMVMTLDQALLPHNFKRLSVAVQNGLLNGKSASQMLKEMI